MWTAVLQATAISTVSLIVTHHAGNRMFSDFFEDPAMMNFTAHFTNSTTPVNALNLTIEKAPTGQATYDRLHGAAVQDASKEGSDEAHELPFKVTITNSTALNETISAAREQEEPFYTRELPLGILTSFIMCALQYCWLIGLERALPARSRRRDVIVADKGEMSEDREEEVVKKWIAQGRVRRASLNWCNTFLKWILSLTIGRVWWFTVEFVVYRSLRLESPRKIWGDMLRVSFGCLGLPPTPDRITRRKTDQKKLCRLSPSIMRALSSCP
jgi:hypothetical protein